MDKKQRTRMKFRTHTRADHIIDSLGASRFRDYSNFDQSVLLSQLDAQIAALNKHLNDLGILGFTADFLRGPVKVKEERERSMEVLQPDAILVDGHWRPLKGGH